jgi:2-hydroxy-3-oxopropionate reductase
VHVAHRSPDRVASLLEQGAQWAGSPRALAEASDVLVVVFPDLPDLEPMLPGDTGILAGISRPTVMVIASTSSASGVRELDERVERLTGGLLRVIDSPVSGGEEGALSLFVGGPAGIVERARPVLETFGRVHHLGPLGSGEVAKYCNQLVVSATVHALGEAAVLADRSGLDVAALFAALAGGYADSRVLEPHRCGRPPARRAPGGVPRSHRSRVRRRRHGGDPRMSDATPPDLRPHAAPAG